MKDRPQWFVVIRRNGRDEPAKYRDFLPHWIRGKNAKEWGVINVTELHTMVHPDFWCALGLRELWRHHCAGTLGNVAVVERQRAYEAGNEKWPLLLTETTVSVEITETTVVGKWPVAPGFEGM